MNITGAAGGRNSYVKGLPIKSKPRNYNIYITWNGFDGCVQSNLRIPSSLRKAVKLKVSADCSGGPEPEAASGWQEYIYIYTYIYIYIDSSYSVNLKSKVGFTMVQPTQDSRLPNMSILYSYSRYDRCFLHLFLLAKAEITAIPTVNLFHKSPTALTETDPDLARTCVMLHQPPDQQMTI